MNSYKAFSCPNVENSIGFIYFSNFNCISNQHFINSKMLPRESNGQFIFYHYLFLENEYLGSNQITYDCIAIKDNNTPFDNINGWTVYHLDSSPRYALECKRTRIKKHKIINT